MQVEVVEEFGVAGEGWLGLEDGSFEEPLYRWQMLEVSSSTILNAFSFRGGGVT